ncbi:MAG: peptide deformylase [Proteobacteria bacterium]|nr:peptide deformylase [Pseudomonadota bacterium]
MAILPIARMGSPVLRARAADVPDPTHPDIARLVQDMTETMYAVGGAGIAAPQVHVSQRVVLYTVPASRSTGAEEDQPQGLTAIVNPTIEPLGEETVLGWEGCLSVPGMRGVVPRFARVRYSGWLLTGERIERLASGWHARVVQHEFDHLDGILYPMRMTDMSLFGFTEELAQAAAAAGMAAPRPGVDFGVGAAKSGQTGGSPPPGPSPGQMAAED